MILSVSAFANTEKILCSHLFVRKSVGESVKTKFYSPQSGSWVFNLSGADPHFYANFHLHLKHGSLGRNILTASLVTRTPDGRRWQGVSGKAAFEFALSEFSKNGLSVDAFAAVWVDKMPGYLKRPSVNYLEFIDQFALAWKSVTAKKLNQLKRDELSNIIYSKYLAEAFQRAANNTWTGKMMAELGFSAIESIEIKNDLSFEGIDGNQGSIGISVLWTLPQLRQGVLQIYDPTTAGHGRPMGISSLPRLIEVILKYHPEI